LLFSADVDSTTSFPDRAFSRLKTGLDFTTSGHFGFAVAGVTVIADSLGWFLVVSAFLGKCLSQTLKDKFSFNYRSFSKN
jgi:hypothetical protein